MSDHDRDPLRDSSLSGLRQPLQQNNLVFDMVKPFGPSILETELPSAILSNMLKLTEQILADADRESWGRYLVGQIREEPSVPETTLKEFGVLDYLRGLFAEYVIACMYCDSNPEYKRGIDQLRQSGQYRNPTCINIESAWIISQQAGEYNPIHNHSQATLTSVMYLKMPEHMHDNPIPNKESTDGCIEFVDRSAGDNLLQLQTSTVRLKPQIGRFYIFPASLLHLVYPFSGKGERRSVSINVNHRI